VIWTGWFLNRNVKMDGLFKKSGLALLSVILICSNVYSQSSSARKVYPEKKMVLEYLDRPEVIEKYGKISDDIWSVPELGLQEERSSGILIRELEEAGFTVEKGLAGMPTCFVATYGSGKPVVGILTEYDALPMISQKGRVPYADPVIEGAPGHGCGHNMMGTASISASVAVKKAMEKYGIKGTIKVFGSPAEESLLSRPYMIRAGLFEGVDVVIDNHADDSFGTHQGILGNAMYSVVFTFSGKTAHSAGAPWEGRSALDAVEVMNVATNFLREHLPYSHRMHYVITEGGEIPNVVPDKASVWYFLRDTDQNVTKMYEQVVNCAKGAALATGTELVEVRVLTAIHQLHYNKQLASLLQKNIELVGMPEWTEEEVEFALALQKSLEVEEKGMPTEVNPLRPTPSIFVGGGSSDVGDVTLIAPTAPVFFPGVVPGAIWHHWSLVSCTYGSMAWKGLNAGAKVIAASAIDLLTQPKELEAVVNDFQEYSKKHPYIPFLPEDSEPDVEMNREDMEKWRSKMKADR
jgi:aminobenzoyl-glutamate utilization protein B